VEAVAVIVKAGAKLQGSRMRGLLAYLLGPGRHTEHVDPRILAAWTDLDFLPGFAARSHSERLTQLARGMEIPVKLISPACRPEKYVWHCIVQNDRRVDPVLSDQQWAVIAQELIDAVGLIDHHWVAVRHDDHGIHLAATLVSQEGQRARLSHEIRRLNACRVRLEAQYCTRRTDPGTRTGGIGYQRHEMEKAVRHGESRPVRVKLRNTIRTAAVASSNPEEFKAALRKHGVLVGFRYSTRSPGQITGYKVALESDRNRDREPVWYKASAIDKSLTRPHIAAQLDGRSTDTSTADWAVLASRYTTRIRIAVSKIAAASEVGDDVGAALGDIVVALDLARPRGMDDQAWTGVLDRAFWATTPDPATARGSPGRTGAGLRAAARVIANASGADTDSWVAIAYDLTRALRAVSQARAVADRQRQADHATRAAALLETCVRDHASRPVQHQMRQHLAEVPTTTETHHSNHARRTR
jgi:hypothetical protein